MRTPYINKFQFYDTETSGIDTKLDQIYQFASVETDSDLNVIDEGVSNIICRPRLDVVPHPKAFLTHFLDIDLLKSEGMNEFMLARKIQNIFMGSNGTAVSGYNTGKFDDELVRNLMFRNMKDMYQHEWKNENVRFDVYKLIQLVYSLRPELINWRKKDDGNISLKLEHLSADNGIIHENAHDALDDVYATIGIAKKVKEANPKLFNYCLQMCSKSNPMSLLAKREPLIHVDTVHGQDFKISTLIQPVVIDKENKSKFICLDLRYDPRNLLQMSSNDIRKYLFTKREDLPEGSPKIPIIGVQVNKQPIIAETKGLLTSDFADDARLNIDEVNRNLEFIKGNNELASLLQEAMQSKPDEPKDVYQTIYSGGFLHRDDHNLRANLHMKSDGESLKIENIKVHDYALSMRDSVRHFELLLRGKWNSFYSHLMTEDFSPTEFRKWVDYLEEKLYVGFDGEALTIPKFYEEANMAELEMPLNSHEKEILDKVVIYIKDVEKTVSNLRELADELFQESESEKKSSKAINEIEKRISIAQRYKDKTEDNNSLSIEPNF